MNITKTNSITPELERELHALEAICKDEGQKQDAYLNGELNFNKALPYIYIARDESGALIGFIGIFMPVLQAEIYAYVRPDMRQKGVFTALINEVREDLAKTDVKRMLFQLEPCAKNARLALKKYPEAKLDRTEYTMLREREGDAPLSQLPDEMRYERVTRDNLKAYCHLTNVAFDDYEDDENSEMNIALYSSPDRAAYMALDALGEPAGAVCLVIEQEDDIKQAFIYGLCVRADARRMGLGRALLGKALEISFASGDVSRAKLDVETNNPAALELYSSCGFHELCTVEYWAVPIK